SPQATVKNSVSIVPPLMFYGSRMEDRRLRIALATFHLPSSILDSCLSGVPVRITLGDGNEDDGNYGNDETDGRDAAAHAVEIKKVEQGAERLGAGTIEK